MKRIIGICFLVLTLKPIYADLGSSSGGGGGVAEKNIVFAFQNLNHYIQMSLSTARLNVEEQKTLRTILKNLENEGAPATLFEFSSEKQNPNFFMIDGAVRIAKTKYQVGERIYFNTDLLYSKKETKNGTLWVPISLFSSVSLLVHELGHHAGIKDHLFLDNLGSKVEVQLLKSSQTIDGALFDQFIKLTLIYNSPRIEFSRASLKSANVPSTKPEFTQMLIEDKDGIKDITYLLEELKNSDLCKEETQDKSSTLQKVFFYNPHFTGRNPWASKNLDLFKISIQGKMDIGCGSGEMSLYQLGKYDLRLSLSIKTNFPRDLSFSFVDGSTELFQCNEPNPSSQCH